MAQPEHDSNTDTSAPRQNQTTLLVGLSGPSSSGKTTLARLLRQIFNTTTSTSSTSASASPPKTQSTGNLRLFILHEDDFYKTDTQIPVKSITSADYGARDLQDWDCAESLDLPLLKTTLEHIKLHGALPADMFSKEDQNTVGESGVADETVREYQRETATWLQGLRLQVTQREEEEEEEAKSTRSASNESPTVVICLFDGFLLYPDPAFGPDSLERQLHETLQGVLDVKLFVSGTRQLTVERRAKRTGYVTLEGFWADPPGYVEDVVWPNYRRDHVWLFEREGDDWGAMFDAVDAGRVNRDTAAEVGILVGPGDGDAHLREIVPWAVERLKEAVAAAVHVGS